MMENFKCLQHGCAFEQTGVGEFAVQICPMCSEEKDQEPGKRRQANINSAIENAAVPPRFRKKTLDNYYCEPGSKQAFTVQTARWFLENMKTCAGLILIGNPGTGKTHIAAGIVNEHLQVSGQSALCIEAVKIIRAVKEIWNHNGKTETEVLRSFLAPDILVVDEIGMQFGSPTEKRYLSEIINDRYNWLRPTVICGNVSIGDLIGILGGEVVDRFREGGKAIIFDWESYRGKNAT